jgi:hypothetical protein
MSHERSRLTRLRLRQAPRLGIVDRRQREGYSAILIQPYDDGVHNLIAYESCKLTAFEQDCPTNVMEVHALRVFRNYLLGTGSWKVGSGAPRHDGVRSDFGLRTENQAVTWPRIKRDVNRFLAL